MTRPRVLFDPQTTVPCAISRSGLELFTNCPRCFYFDKRLGQSRPSRLPFTLNMAVYSPSRRRRTGSTPTVMRPHPASIKRCDSG